MSPPRHGHTPHFPLETVQRLVAAGKYRLTFSARAGADLLYLDEADVVDCISRLTERDYSHSLAAEKRPGAFQDVYLCRYRLCPIYLKVQMSDPSWVQIVSLKRNESA